MPSIKKFTIKNFKGIEEVELDLDGRIKCPVMTLIGLNESGKTTILEALSHFVSGDRSVSELFEGPHAKASGVRLIPINKKAAFSSKVEIIASIELSEEDLSAVRKKIDARVDIDMAALSAPFSITRSYKFEDSVLKGTSNFWGFKLLTRNNKKGQFKEYVRPKELERDLWHTIYTVLLGRLPNVSYFPTFLVDMPQKIYLKAHDKETAINRHYRFVLQDILDSLGENLSLEKHVCNRIEEFKSSENTPNWFSIFFGGPTKAPIDSVFQKIANAVTGQVLGSWQRVFQRAISAKSISVEWSIDAERDHMPYAMFYVSDGESRYAISERSLGFRWFFSFLLFTAFKQGKERKTIFIFDEPAANLHAKAQAELLTSFSKIASDGNRVIYSTHSHHMINPRWLSGAYIVENTALDYDSGDNFGLSTKPTNVKATSYRQFVANYPSRSSYFQPVIEQLEYVSPEVVGEAPYLLVEGISDYYALRLAQRISNRSFGFRLLPGVGAGACGPLVSQLLGRGELFAILLDDDKAGKKEAQRYVDEWFLATKSVCTIETINPKYAGFQIEGLIDSETRTGIQEKLEVSTLTKKQIGLYLAESVASENLLNTCLSKRTIGQLLEVLDYFDDLLVDHSQERLSANG